MTADVSEPAPADEPDRASHQGDVGQSSSERLPQMHLGHVPEWGVLMRVREWVDVFPWARLARVLRLAASPTLVVMLFFVGSIWWMGMRWIGIPHPQAWEPGAVSNFVPSLLGGLDMFLRVAWYQNPSSCLLTNHSLLLSGGAFLWSALCWTTPVLMVSRQGALLTANRPLMGIDSLCRLACQRTPVTWLVIIVPWLCVIPFVGAVWLLGLVQQWTGNSQLVGSGLAIVSAFLLIPVGILVTGSFVALPLAFSSIINEQHADPLDALSRGYEAVLRRPWCLLVSIAFAFGCLLPIVLLVTVMASVAGRIAIPLIPSVPSIGIPPAGFESPAMDVAPPWALIGGMASSLLETLQFFPACVAFALSWGMIGGIYLLIRRATGGQEVEDIWIPLTSPTPPLPKLPTNTETESSPSDS